jgi:hypothetical protein
MSEKYRLDASLLSGGQTAVVVCLPRAYVDLLLDWSIRLRWSIYIDQNGNRVPPDDAQLAMLEIGYKGLVEAMCLEELTSILDLRLSAIASAIGNISGGNVEIDIQPLTSAVLEVSAAVGELTAVIGQGEEEEVNIVNNLCCCSCGNGGNGGNPDDALPPDIPPDDLPLPPLPDGTNEPYDPSVFPVTAGVCAITHYTLVQWRNLCIGIANGEVTRANMIERLNATLPGVLSPVSGISWMVTAVQMALYLALYFVGFVGRGGDVAREIDSKLDVFKCIVLNDAPFAEKISQGRAIINSFALPSTLRMVIGILWQFLPFSGMRLFSSADQIYLTLLPSWAFVPCPPCVGGDDDDEPEYPDPVQSGLFIRDHTSTSNQSWISTDNSIWQQLGTTGYAFQFYRRYYLTDHPTLGTGAMHCQLTSTPTANPVICDVDFTNSNVIPVTVMTRVEGEVQVDVVVPAGQTVTLRTSRLDTSAGISGYRCQVVITGVSDPI